MLDEECCVSPDVISDESNKVGILSCCVSPEVFSDESNNDGILRSQMSSQSRHGFHRVRSWTCCVCGAEIERPVDPTVASLRHPHPKCEETELEACRRRLEKQAQTEERGHTEPTTETEHPHGAGTKPGRLHQSKQQIRAINRLP